MKLITENRDKLYIKQAVAMSMLEEAIRVFPREACGMLGGSRRRVAKVYPTKNLEKGNMTYEVDPVEAFNVIKQMREEGNELIASWHSHPMSEAYPSMIDTAKAVDAGLVYVIVSLSDIDIRAYYIEGDWIKELEVIIE